MVAAGHTAPYAALVAHHELEGKSHSAHTPSQLLNEAEAVQPVHYRYNNQGVRTMQG